MVSFISDRLLLAALVVLTLQASDVMACATCTGATPEPVRQAYNYSTAWLSFIPLIFMGAVIYFIYRAVKRGRAEEQQ
jgi:heme/copper-type cytochrome/quinol oxidase subunit 2